MLRREKGGVKAKVGLLGEGKGGAVWGDLGRDGWGVVG